MVVAGKIIAPLGGQFRTRADKQFLLNDEYPFADTKDEIIKAIRENTYYSADVIKVVVDEQRYPFSLDDLKLIVTEARNAGLKIMAHCQTPAGEYALKECLPKRYSVINYGDIPNRSPGKYCSGLFRTSVFMLEKICNESTSRSTETTRNH